MKGRGGSVVGRKAGRGRKFGVERRRAGIGKGAVLLLGGQE
jgi:hypothetical protein